MTKRDDTNLHLKIFHEECSLHIKRLFVFLLFVNCSVESLAPFQWVNTFLFLLYSTSNRNKPFLLLYLLHETDFLGLEGLVHQSYLCNGQSKSHPFSCHSHPFAGIGHKSFLSCKVKEICTKLRLSYPAKNQIQRFLQDPVPCEVVSTVRQRALRLDK